MQRVRPKRRRWPGILILLGIVLILGGLIWGGILLFATSPATTVIATKMLCPDDSSIRAFGNNVLYYDGYSIHCLSSTSPAQRWRFDIGADAGFDCNSKIVVAWVASTIYIIDQNGNSSYNDNLGETIQFARAGDQYVAAVIGDTTKPRLVMKDHTGAHMDEESDAYEDLIVLDVGFYGRNGEYMWTLALDVFGMAPNTILKTYTVGSLNIGEVSLGENITYQVVYENSILRVVSTRNMRSFNYRGTEDPSQNVLVYGWRMIGSDVPERGSAMLLFAPTAQTDNQYDIRELRLISGSVDRRFSLPSTCIGGLVWGRNLYALSGTALYRAGMNASRFAEYELPLPTEATRYIGLTDNGRAIVACGEDVYTLSLPGA